MAWNHIRGRQTKFPTSNSISQIWSNKKKPANLSACGCWQLFFAHNNGFFFVNIELAPVV
jgi:hypothetical protein